MSETDTLKRYNEALEAFDKARQEVKSKGQAVIVELFSDFMSKHSAIEQIQFEAFTPFFNDGDTCEWGIHGVYVGIDKASPLNKLANYGPEDENDQVNFYMGWRRKDGTALDDLCADAESFVYKNSELIKDALGDHIRVCVKPTGLEITELYDHY